MQVVTRGAEETRALGEALGERLCAGDVLCLSGQLGAGKTTLSQGIGQGLGVTEPVTSPTFALVHEYAGRLPVWHLDTYRVGGPEELIDLSWDDLLSGGGVVLVEWPERIAEALPDERLDLELSQGAGDRREIRLLPRGSRMRELVRELEAAWGARMPSSSSGERPRD